MSPAPAPSDPSLSGSQNPLLVAYAGALSWGTSRGASWRSLLAIWVWLACGLAAVVAWGQEDRRGERREPPGRFETLDTKDGVRIRVGWFPPKEPGKDVVPVILVHEWEGQFSPYFPLAVALKEAGCAVIVPELRGHGASRTFRTPGGEEREFDLSKMGPADVSAMLARDLESVKAFLKEKNNEEILNLNALTMIGVGEGAVLATNWAIRDWNFPSTGSRKQGQDVKALVMVSPEKMLKGLKLDNLFRDRFIPLLPTLIVAGGEGSDSTEATRIHKRLEGIKRRVRKGDPSDLKLEMVPTSLSEAQLVQQVPPVTQAIVRFIKEQVIAKAGQFPWVDRS